MRFHKLVLCIYAALFALILSTGYANADSYSLDTIINGGSSLTSGQPSFGTISFTQDGTSVDVTATLSNPDWKLLEIDFNYNPALGGSPALTASTNNMAISNNGIRVDGYNGYLDISIPASGNLGNVSSYTTTLSLNNGSTTLYASDFNFKDTLGNLYAAAHIGNYPQGGSIWVGSETGTVPEPATLILLGSGLVGLGGFKTIKKTKILPANRI